VIKLKIKSIYYLEVKSKNTTSLIGLDLAIILLI